MGVLSTYASAEYYVGNYGGSTFDGDDERLTAALYTASRHIDSLTYNRIVAIGFDNLTEFQQEIIRRVACGLADFEEENSDALNSALSGYSINGVNQQFSKSWTICTAGGVTIPASLYSVLKQTGLTCRRL